MTHNFPLCSILTVGECKSDSMIHPSTLLTGSICLFLRQHLALQNPRVTHFSFGVLPVRRYSGLHSVLNQLRRIGSAQMKRIKKEVADIRRQQQQDNPHNQQPTLTVDRIVRRAEAGRILGRSPRTIDRLARTGILRRVMFRGHTRGAGYSYSEIQRLVTGKGGAV